MRGVDVTVRRLGEADSLDELTALLHRAYAALAARGLRYVASHQSVEVTRRRVAHGECWVAERAGRVVGTVTLSAPGTPVRDEAPRLYARPDVAHFAQFGIEPELQRHGIGSLLMTRVEARARELGAREIALDTSEHARDLIAWYVARGYRPAGRHDWRPHVNYESVLLSKRLADT